MSLVPVRQRLEGGVPASMPGGTMASRQRPAPAQSVDLVGPLLRRKYVVFLMAILGAGAGWLVYQRTPPEYESVTQLMVWTQAPPSVVGQDAITPKVSVEKYSNLLNSQVVLERAIEDGALASTSTLGVSQAPLRSLKSILKVKSDKSDTLLISAIGPDREELPKILNAVVDAFKETLEQDTKASGGQSIELIQKMHEKRLDERNIAQRKYLEILKRLGVIERNPASGDVINPFVAQRTVVETELAGYESELQGILSRLALVVQAKESGDDQALRVSALEGQKFLGLAYRPSFNNLDEKTRAQRVGERVDIQNQQRVQFLENNLFEIRFKLIELGHQRDSQADRYGKRHESVMALDQRILTWQGEQSRLQQEVGELKAALEASMNGSADEGSELAEGQPDWDEMRRRDEAEWLQLYFVALNRSKDRLTQVIDRLKKRSSEIQAKASAIASDVEEANVLRKQIEDKRNNAQAALDSLADIDLVRENYNEVRVSQVDEPNIGQKVAPSLLKCLAMGIFLLGLCGAGMAILIDKADHSFRNPNEIAGIFSAPVVGKIPRIRGLLTKNDAHDGAPALVASHQPNSAAGEAFRSIRTAMFFASNSSGAKTFLFTSPSPGDGKSTTAANLAVSIAQAGKKVCLVDCDLRRPRVHRYFDVDTGPGFTELVNGKVKLKEALRQVVHSNLYLLTSGERPENPGEFITLPRVLRLIDQLKEKFDFVLIDSPPVLPVADPVFLSTYVDCIYVVLRIRKGVSVMAERTVDSLSRVEANVEGVIVNGVDQNPYYNEYGYSYGFQNGAGYDGGYRYSPYGSYYGDSKPTNGSVSPAKPRLLASRK